MANLDFDNDEGPVSLMHRRAAINLATSMGDDPEETARALQLSQSSGVPAPVISADLEGFEQDHKASLSNEVVKRNQFLQAYLADETAAKLSHDDIGPLDQASESIKKLNQPSKLQQWLEATNPTSVKKAIQESAAAPAARGLAKAFEEGYGPAPLGWEGVRPEDLEWALSHPLTASVTTAVATPLEAISRVTKGLINLGHAGTESIFGKQFADDMAGMVEYSMTAPEVAAAHYQDPLRQAMESRAKEMGLEPPDFAKAEAEAVPKPPAEPTITVRSLSPEERQAANLELVQKHADKIRDLMHSQQVSDIFHEAGEEPPPHIDPLIDKAKADQIREDLQRLKDAVGDSAGTATRERSADHFARFADLHGPGEIGIDSAEIRRIYGDKVPEDGDGLLGWIPGLGDRLARAEMFGGDIWVDRAQFLAKTEREVVNEIGDGLRLRDGGVTVGETKIEVDPKQVIAEDLPAVRGGAGMEPRAHVGDRKLTLRMREPVERQAQRMAEAAGHTWEDLAPEDQQEWMKESREGGVPSAHDIDIHNDTGERIGSIVLAEHEDGKLLFVENIRAGPEESFFKQANYLGYTLVKDLKRQLKSMFPQAEWLTGVRISGARAAAEAPMEISMPRVRLDVAEDPQNFRDMLSALWRPIYESPAGIVEALHWTPGKGLAMNSPMGRLVLGEIQRLAPGAKGEVVHGLAFTDRPEMQIRGAYLPGIRQIVTSLEGKDPLGTTRHEVIHFLRQTGLFSEAEWSRLISTSLEQGWREKFGIDRRYGKLSESVQMEESIAEAYRHWADGRLKVSDAEIFERIKQFLQNMLEKVQEQLGLKDVTWDEIFEKVESGEIGKRGVEEAPAERAPLAMQEPDEEDVYHGTIASAFEKFDPALSGGEEATYFSSSPETAGGYAGVEGGKVREGARIYPARLKINKDTTLFVKEADVLKDFAEGLGKVRNLVDEAREAGKSIIRLEKVDGEFEYAVLDPKMIKSRFGGEPLGMAEHPEDRADFPVEKGKTVGAAEGFLRREEKLLKELQERDWKADQKRQQKQIREQLLPEAKARGKEINKQVREEFAGRPDLAVDKFMSEGQVKFDPDHLTTEQKERLPKDYVAKGGMNPDDLAGTLGYTSGDAMVERLAMLTEDRKRSGLDQKAYYNKQVKAEVEKRLNAELGPKRDEMLQEYRDHALSETQMQLTHVETMRKAVELGITPQFTFENMKAMAKSVMEETPIGEIKSARYLQKAGATAMKVAEAEQKGQHPEAYRLLQQKQLAQLVAKQATEYERGRKSFDRTVKNYVKNPTAETAKKIDIPYYNWIQQTIARLGYGVDVPALAERIKLEDHQTLNDFIAAKKAELRELNVPDFVRDPTWPGSKTLKDLTYREFSDLHDMIKTMEHEGRDEKMLVKGGEQIALDEGIEDLVNQVKDIAALPPETLKKDRQTPVRDVAKGIWWGHITPEAMWDRLDRGNVRGLFHQLLIYPAARAVNAKLTMLREYGKRFNEIDFKDMDKKVENTLFRDPETGQLIEMRRRNMLGVLAYWGNESNIKKLTEGWGVDRPAVEAWLRKNSRPEDWAEMQKVGGIFKDLMKEAQKMSRATTSVLIKEVDIQPFTDPHGFAREGWYSPVDYEAERPKGKAATGANELERPGYYRATTDQRYAKARTGKIAPTDLTLDIIPQRMGQMIHDITTRPTSIEMGKILHDERIQRAINSVYGKAQMDEMRSWLQDMTNQTNVDVAGQKAMNQVAGFLRANVIGNLIGFAPSTVLKHVPTAAVNSIAQVGPLNFLKATKELFQTDGATGMRKAKLAYDESEELQGRMHNYADLLRGQGESFQFEQGTAAWLRELNLKLGAMPVSFGDYVSTLPVYWAARNDALARGASLDMAIDIGNKAVRDAHGTFRLTAQPSVMRTTNEMARMYTSLYGFFSHMLQQQYKWAWKARDILNGQKPLDIEGHWAPHMLGKFMSYYIIPAVIEELVTPYTNEEKDSWGKKAAKGLAMGLSSSLTVVRDLVRTLINPEQRTGGLMDTVMDTPRNVIKDLSGPMNKQKAGNLIKDTIALNGILTGTTNATEGRVAEYITRYSQGLERPKGPWDVATGLRYGKTDKHAHTFAEWWKHTVEGKR